MDDVAAGSVAQPRLTADLVAVFAGSALLLAAIGIYGVMAYLVAQRANTFQLIVGQGLRLVVIGIAIGLIASVAIMRLLSTLLFGTRVEDVSTLSTAAGVFVAVGVAACYIPLAEPCVSTHTPPCEANKLLRAKRLHWIDRRSSPSRHITRDRRRQDQQDRDRRIRRRIERCNSKQQ
jgi:putative ABC transport system permease protein